MKISKNQWIVIGVLGAIAIWYFFLRKKNETKESGYDNFQLDDGSLESAYGPQGGAYGNYGNESGYITCPAGKCEVSWSYWSDSNPPVHLSGSYCGNCKTGSKAFTTLRPPTMSNYVEKRKTGGTVGKQSGGGICLIKWTDDKGVSHTEEVPCSTLKNEINSKE